MVSLAACSHASSQRRLQARPCGAGGRRPSPRRQASGLLRAHAFLGRLSSAIIPSSPPAAPLLSGCVCVCVCWLLALPCGLALWHCGCPASQARGLGREVRVHTVPWEKHPCQLNYALGFDRLIVKEHGTAADGPARPTKTPGQAARYRTEPALLPPRGTGQPSPVPAFSFQRSNAAWKGVKN